MYARGAKISKLLGANFVGNVALFGGGLSLEEGGIFKTGSSSRSSRHQFSDNVAHRGGGLYLKAGNYRLERYQVAVVSSLCERHASVMVC